MARMGFIHDKLDIKLMVLYLLSRAAAPMDFATLTDLSMCDPGVDYFAFAEAVSELMQSGHVTAQEGLYAITEKGRRNSADCESSLSPVIRRRCDRQLVPVNAQLRRNAQVRASVEAREDGEYVLHLSLDDDRGNLLTLHLTAASLEQSEQMAERFRERPEEFYHSVLSALLSADEATKETQPHA